jgi:hypothetical protein
MSDEMRGVPTSGDELWLAAAAGLQSELDADLRDEAYEVFVVEAARSRLQDRVGPARLSLRCGLALEGQLGAEDVIGGHLRLRDHVGRHLVVPVAAVVTVSGTRPGLRPEGHERTLTSWLREAWSSGDPVSVLACSGQWIAGRLTRVGGDHVDLDLGEAELTVAIAAVEAWRTVSC